MDREVGRGLESGRERNKKEWRWRSNGRDVTGKKKGDIREKEEKRVREGERKERTRDEEDISYSLFARKKIAGSISACWQLGGQLVVPREVTGT